MSKITQCSHCKEKKETHPCGPMRLCQKCYNEADPGFRFKFKGVWPKLSDEDRLAQMKAMADSKAVVVQ